MAKFETPFPVEQLHDRVKRLLPAWFTAKPSAVEGASLPVYAGAPVLGQLVGAVRDPLALCIAAMRQHGDCVRIPLRR